MTGHFGSLVPGDRPQQRRRQVRHPQLQSVVQGVAVALQKMQQSDHPGLPFNERTDRRALVLAYDEISFRKTEGWPGRVGCGSDRLAVTSLTGNVRPAFWGRLGC